MLLARCRPDLPGGIDVHGRDPKADDEVRLCGRPNEGRHQTRRDDGDVRQGVVAGREKRGAREASSMSPVPREHEGARQVDDKGPGTGERERYGCCSPDLRQSCWRASSAVQGVERDGGRCPAVREPPRPVRALLLVLRGAPRRRRSGATGSVDRAAGAFLDPIRSRMLVAAFVALTSLGAGGSLAAMALSSSKLLEVLSKAIV